MHYVCETDKNKRIDSIWYVDAVSYLTSAKQTIMSKPCDLALIISRLPRIEGIHWTNIQQGTLALASGNKTMLARYEKSDGITSPFSQVWGKFWYGNRDLFAYIYIYKFH